MKEGYLESEGYKVHFCRWGNMGPKVLLIHSMGMDLHSMDKLAESLKDEYKILSLTILDHGESDPPKGVISLPELSEVMRGCYKKLDFEPTVLIGHSVGGMIGIVLTSEHPDEFKGLVLVDIAPFESSGRTSRPAPPEYFESRVEAKKWVADRYPSFTEYYVENRLDNAFNVKDGKYYLKPRGDNIWNGLVMDLWPYMERIKCQVQTQKGELSDLITPKTIERMSVMPNVEIVEVEGADHMIPQEVPEKFEELIRDFLSEVY